MASGAGFLVGIIGLGLSGPVSNEPVYDHDRNANGLM